MATWSSERSHSGGVQKENLSFPAPMENVDVVCGFSTTVKPLAGGRRAKTGVSGVGGKPVQLASDEAELLDDELDSKDCFLDLLLLLAAVKH